MYDLVIQINSYLINAYYNKGEDVNIISAMHFKNYRNIMMQSLCIIGLCKLIQIMPIYILIKVKISILFRKCTTKTTEI